MTCYPKIPKDAFDTAPSWASVGSKPWQCFPTKHEIIKIRNVEGVSSGQVWGEDGKKGGGAVKSRSVPEQIINISGTRVPALGVFFLKSQDRSKKGSTSMLESRTNKIVPLFSISHAAARIDQVRYVSLIIIYIHHCGFALMF